MSKALRRKTKSRSNSHELRVARVHDEKAHHAHGHLHHLVGVRVVHEGAALGERELVDEGLARSDMRLGEPADTVHAVRQQHAVPVNRGVLGQAVGHEDANLVAFDRLDGRAGRLAVVAPQVRLHAGRDLAHDRLGHQVVFLPVAVLARGQRPAIERDHRLVVGAARRTERRLHRRLVGGGRFRDARRLHAAADRRGAYRRCGGIQQSSA